MIKRICGYLAIGAFLLGFLFCIIVLLQPVTLDINGQKTTVPASGVTAGSILRKLGIPVKNGDQLKPPAWIPMLFTRSISLTTSAEVGVFNGSVLTELNSTERNPANLLLEAGIHLYPFDTVIADGQPAKLNMSLPPAARHTLQYRAAQPITYTDGIISLHFYSSASTVGEALWEQGIHLAPGDLIRPHISEEITGPLEITLKHGRELTIIDGGNLMKIRSSATNVGEALQDAGLSPQGLDYCLPAEDQPIPTEGIIHLVRVREELLVTQTPIPNTVEYQADANTELDQQTLIDPGSYGLEVQQIKVRYEDNREVSRHSESRWVIRSPRPRIIGYGTKIVIRSAQVDGNTIEYWRSITVYATSYSPCRSGVSECIDKTANGMTVKKGVVGVILSWYKLMNGQHIYVPGYGNAIIADVGGGIAGRDWIDLGFSDDDYVSWHSTVTIYFLTPVPTNIPWILP